MGDHRLTGAFFSWYRYSNRDVMVLILALSMIAYVINGIAGLAIYLDLELVKWLLKIMIL